MTLNDVERKQLIWYGHMERMSGNRFPTSSRMDVSEKTKERKQYGKGDK
jgi:hypothetical protein